MLNDSVFFVRLALLPLTHTADVKPGAKDHGEQEKHRNEHNESIPQLL